jgi:hypothetical protein
MSTLFGFFTFNFKVNLKKKDVAEARKFKDVIGKSSV